MFTSFRFSTVYTDNWTKTQLLLPTY